MMCNQPHIMDGIKYRLILSHNPLIMDQLAFWAILTLLKIWNSYNDIAVQWTIRQLTEESDRWHLFLSDTQKLKQEKFAHRYLSDHFIPVIISVLIARSHPTVGCHVIKNQRNQSWSFFTPENISNMNNDWKRCCLRKLFGSPKLGVGWPGRDNALPSLGVELSMLETFGALGCKSEATRR